jgi:hypothetical protein
MKRSTAARSRRREGGHPGRSRAVRGPLDGLQEALERGRPAPRGRALLLGQERQLTQQVRATQGVATARVHAVRGVAVMHGRAGVAG